MQLKTIEYIRIQFAKSDEVILEGEQYPYIEVSLRQNEINVFVYESSTGHSYDTMTGAIAYLSDRYPLLRIKGIETKLFTKLM